MPSNEPPPAGNGRPNGVVRQIRRVLAALFGTTVILVGAAMLVLPGPGVVVLVLGLSILAAEFTWAHHLLKRVRREGKRVVPEKWRHFVGLKDDPA